MAQLPAGPLHPGKGAHASPGAAAGGVPGLRGAAGHADRLGSRLHCRPVRHAAGRPAGALRDPQAIREQRVSQFQAQNILMPLLFRRRALGLDDVSLKGLSPIQTWEVTKYKYFRTALE